jgi:hypothetical protein
MSLTVDLPTGRAAFAESVTTFVHAVDALDEWDLLGASRCHGWTRLDVVVHVIAGWQEMLGGMVSPVDGPPTVDAASYWTAFAEFETGDPLLTLLAQRRRTAAYARPRTAWEQLHDVAGAVRRGADGLPDHHVTWQGQVFTPGDFLAVWAVEDVVHQLDLDVDQHPDATLPPTALRLTRATVEALAAPFPDGWSAEEVVLVGTGRSAVPEGLGALADRLPVLG